MNEVSNFYDDFSEKQAKSGVHKRHIFILEWLKRFGLKKNSRVLEIGCGVGTVTGLISEFVSNGNILANDISSENILKAKLHLKNRTNIEFLTGDICQSTIASKYDVIVLPDVLEHIPKESHEDLFNALYKILNDSGFIAIHIPNPYYLEWVHKNRPEELQIIDQPLHLDMLGEIFYKAGFYMSHMQTYSIWNGQPDYQIIKLGKTSHFNTFNALPNNKSNTFARILRKIKSTLGLSVFKLPI